MSTRTLIILDGVGVRDAAEANAFAAARPVRESGCGGPSRVHGPKKQKGNA